MCIALSAFIYGQVPKRILVHSARRNSTSFITKIPMVIRKKQKLRIKDRECIIKESLVVKLINQKISAMCVTEMKDQSY